MALTTYLSDFEAKMPNFDSTEPFRADRAREQYDFLKEALNESKKQPAELLHEDNKVSDATIKANYLNLCESIETWISRVSHSEETDFNARFRSRLTDLDFPRDRWIDLLSTQNNCHLIILSNVIWLYLIANIFDEAFPIGTAKDRNLEDSSILSTPGHSMLFEDIMDVMEEKYQNLGERSPRIMSYRHTTKNVPTRLVPSNQQIEIRNPNRYGGCDLPFQEPSGKVSENSLQRTFEGSRDLDQPSRTVSQSERTFGRYHRSSSQLTSSYNMLKHTI